MRESGLPVLGAIATWPWPLLVALSFATTCTMGDDDSWMSTLLLCTAITAIALPPLLFSTHQRSVRWIRLSVPVATLIPLVLTLGHAADTALGGHHLCGQEFDQYRSAGDEWPFRFYYPIMWGEALALTVAATWPLFAFCWRDHRRAATRRSYST